MSLNSVSVIITTCNRVHDLRKAINSLFRQEILPDEIIIVDDSSNVVIGKEIFDSCPEETICKLIVNDRRMGANYCRNKGIKSASSAIILFLDDDDEFLRGKVNEVKQIYSNESFDFVYHSAIIHYEDYNVSYISAPKKNVTLHDIICSNCIGATSMTGIRSAFLDGQTLFDETLPALQDWDAWISIISRGAKCCYINAPLTKYNVRLSDKSISKSVSKQKEAISILNKKYSSEISYLNVSEVRKRKENIYDVFFFKNLLGGKKILASQYALRAFKVRGRMLYLAASILPFFPLRLIINLRSRTKKNQSMM